MSHCRAEGLSVQDDVPAEEERERERERESGVGRETGEGASGQMGRELMDSLMHAFPSASRVSRASRASRASTSSGTSTSSSAGLPPAIAALRAFAATLEQGNPDSELDEDELRTFNDLTRPFRLPGMPGSSYFGSLLGPSSGTEGEGEREREREGVTPSSVTQSVQNTQETEGGDGVEGEREGREAATPRETEREGERETVDAPEGPGAKRRPE
ncbi:hypothetical protein KIPB_008272 [Kipferlia bialata]|uniref:Uncharacterized protein n=1 Tax=Kipferlia bialata TaxID=797122 RepID=A0A9K3D347_9EUKA|nr:hypothetical protein KIPB_008272 [Kipferlia bialata]|eukprot:g8272.t1